MARQMKAERERRALIIEADGDKQAAIARAEGSKQSAVLQAEGRREAAFRDAEARERLAEAEAKATDMVSQAIAKGDVNAINYFVAQKYVEAFGKFADSANTKTLIVPTDLSSIAGAIAGVSELVKSAGDAPRRAAGRQEAGVGDGRNLFVGTDGLAGLLGVADAGHPSARYRDFPRHAVAAVGRRASAGVVAVACLTGLPLGFVAQVAVFLVLSIILTLLTKRFLKVPGHGPDINDPHKRIVGKQAEILSGFELVPGGERTGRVMFRRCRMAGRSGRRLRCYPGGSRPCRGGSHQRGPVVRQAGIVRFNHGQVRKRKIRNSRCRRRFREATD